MKKLILLIFVLSINLSAQDVVVSEYFNVSGGVPNGEWVELIVLRDGLDMRGYKVRDNSGTGGLEEWQGGVEFKGNLWQNLREGTIIVIRSRGSIAYDADKSDGYIEISAENSTYFNKYCANCGNAWETDALNIAQVGDIIQIIDENDNHVHALGHMPAITGNFIDLSNPKIAGRGALDRFYSIRVVPGGSAAGYGGGFDNNNSRTQMGIVDPDLVRGFPNDKTTNSNFWRSLRQPNWSNQNLNISESDTQIILNWNQAQNDLDNTQGYLVVAYQKPSIVNADLPMDSEMYTIGDAVGESGVVIGDISSHTTTLNYDLEQLRCDVDYTFAVFAYRFSRDAQGNDNEIVNARGRAYNESSFATANYKLEPAGIPIISAYDNTICEGDNIQLSVEYPVNIDRYIWRLDGARIPGADEAEYIATKTGEYEVEIVDQFGCEVESEIFTLYVVDNPKVDLIFNNSLVTKDTTINLCENTTFELIAEGATDYEWYKDDLIVTTGKDFIVQEAGIYYTIGSNQNCKDTSITITVNLINEDYTLSHNDLDFGIVESFSELSFEVTNNSIDDLVINSSNVNQPFEIISPDLPEIIVPGETSEFTARFSPSIPGIYEEVLTLLTNCNTELNITLKGEKPETEVLVDKSSLNFGDILSCEMNDSTRIIKIWSDGDQTLYFNNPDVTLPFSLNSSIENSQLTQGDTLILQIRFEPTTPGEYSQVIEIPYSTDNQNFNNKLEILLEGEYLVPEINIVSQELNLEVDGCVGYIDTFVVVSNIGNVELSNFEVNNTQIELLNQITLKSGQSEVLQFRFTPSQDNETVTFEIENQTCDLSSEITINSVLDGFIFNTIDTLDLGNIISCNPQSKILDIEIAGNSNDNLSISGIIISADFSYDASVIGVEKSVGESIGISITPNIVTSGEIEGIIEINFTPCGTKTVYLKGNIIEPDITLGNAQIVFPEIEPGNIQQVNIEVINNNDFDITLDGINGLGFPFELANTGIFPLTIPGNNTGEIPVIYLQDSYNKNDTSIVDLNISNPCDIPLEATLIGSTSERDLDYIVKTFYNDTLKTIPGQTSIIPVNVEIEGLTNEETINSLTFGISFNRYMIEITDVTPKSDFISDIDMLTDNEFEVNFENNNIQNGNWFDIEIFAYLANNPLSYLYTYSVSSPEINITSVETDSTVIYNDICVVENRAVEYLGETSLSIITNNNQKYISFTPLKDSKTIIELFDVNGRKIEIFNSIKPNSLESQININYLNSGIYFVRMNSGGIVKTAKLLISK